MRGVAKGLVRQVWGPAATAPRPRPLRAVQLLLLLALFAGGCSYQPPPETIARQLPVPHIQGPPSRCLVDCVEMVLRYYGATDSFARVVEAPLPLTVRQAVARVEEVAGTGGFPDVTAFLLERDLSFVDEQLAAARPVILLLAGEDDVAHSVVVTGRTRGSKRYLLHDPARAEPRWEKRETLLSSWDAQGNRCLLVAPAVTSLR